MATLKQQQDLINNQDLITRVRVATINQARIVLADPTKANQHAWYNNVMANKQGGPWLDALVWDVAANPAIQIKMIDEPENHSQVSIDTDVTYVLTTGGAIEKYSIDPNYVPA